MAEVIEVQSRQTRGRLNAKRLRRSGLIPVVLYGHGEETLALSAPAEQISAAIRHGSRLVTLSGAAEDQAFLREVQWDTWGQEVLHVDFTRIRAGDKVEVELVVELRGEAPGIKEGGVVEQLRLQVEISCPVTSVPEKLTVNINSLNLDESIHVRDLELPESAEALSSGDLVIVQCVLPTELPDEDEEGGAGIEPEVIGRKPGEDEESG